MKLVGVAVESRGRIVEVVTTTEENYSKTASFMYSRWSGADSLRILRCEIVVEERE